MIKSNFVAIDTSECSGYPESPFNPPTRYREFNSKYIQQEIDEDNEVYHKVRTLLKCLLLDSENIGTDKWNPFSEFINTGDTIVIKPNLVFDIHPKGPQGSLCNITHASILRPVIDYILLATDGICSIIICDVPLQKANWENLIELSGLGKLVKYYSERNIEIKLLDLRREISYLEDGIITRRDIKDRDPLGYSIIDLGTDSELMPIIEHYKKLEITDYGKGTVSLHHNPSKNEYCIPNTVLSADVFINVPKLKTHRKAGLSCSMKNLIGINGDKRYIAHHRCGSKKTGGDEYPCFKLNTWMKWYLWAFLKRNKLLIPAAKRVKKIFLGKQTLQEYSLKNNSEIMEGSWYGNDTVWRSIKDINKIIFYADKTGSMCQKVQRKYFCLIDGIISGEGEGPMLGDPKKTSIVAAGFNPVAIDKICADLTGFDYNKIPHIREGFKNKFWELVDFTPEEIKTNQEILNFKFKPSKGWEGKIEKDR